MTSGHFRKTGIYVAACILTLTSMAALAPPQTRSTEPTSRVVAQGTIQGHVHDSNGQAVANAIVYLRPATGPQAHAAVFTHTDSEGHYSFSPLGESAYILRAEMNGYSQAIFGPVVLAKNETKTIDLELAPQTSEKTSTQAPEFFDEPQFTVAGVAQATNSGGHGSDAVVRTAEALAKATVSLSKEPKATSTARSAATESSLRDAVARDPENFEANRQLGKLLAESGEAKEALPYLEKASLLRPQDAELHHLRGYVEEKLGNPLQAVREYQRAAELDPSEPNLFDWGTELLTHRALEPASEVFTKGNRMFPKSVRMLVALGVAEYARGSYERAAESLGSASDLDPGNETPYLFMGKMQSEETAPSQETLARLARFQHLEPGNALANYYYAVSLWKVKRSLGALDDATSSQIETLLQKAIQIDPRLGAAHLQLGILYAERGDYAHAILAYRKAIEVSPIDVSRIGVSPELEEAHYRLAQAYRRTGNEADAEKELQIHQQLSKEAKEEAQRERNEIQQFVISLRDEKPN